MSGSGRDRPGMRRALSLALPLLLAACASVPPAPPAPLGEVRGDPPFELSGRLAVRDGERSLTANLRWQFDGGADRLSLSGPLGIGAVEIVRSPGGVVFRDSRGERRAPDAQALMLEALGFALPLEGLRFWVRGQGGPGVRGEGVERDARGRLAAFAEDGWTVTIPAYSPDPLAALPRRLDVQARDLRLRLVIDAWVQPPAGAGGGS